MVMADPQLLEKKVVRKRYWFLELIAPVSQEAVKVQRQGIVLKTPDPVHIQRDGMLMDVFSVFFAENDLPLRHSELLRAWNVKEEVPGFGDHGLYPGDTVGVVVGDVQRY